ncbi:hypothetical protein AJ78_01498 [Emergomyces pasteurianus Ep9510]|uniref:Fe2OG dioxygenase domain-containing protein n=1 Tax=Emergomyces pasteurianus Ep9510 TaxID=1447872 RepID=A0A1J9QTA6_9EURO|nr:hypothetical protein AJ78_01498 [Emergomyces pasteurianus Ep9510]
MASSVLPVIDLRNFSSAEDLAPELMTVGKDPGFFYLIGHELTDDIVRQMFDLADDFFQNTYKEEKMRFVGGGGLGYTGLRDENLAGKGRGDLKESYYLANPDGGIIQALPAILDARKTDIAEFYGKCESLADRLLQAFAVGLKLPQDYLSERHKGDESRLRFLHYPSIEEGGQETPEANQVDIRAGAHTDYGSITLLFRQPSEKGGLQVLINNEWVDIPCVQDAVVVNIADALEFWTCGRLRSTIHRVVFPRNECENVKRLSMPFFVQPDRDVLMEPILRQEVDQDEFMGVLRRKGYSSARALTAEEHLMQRRRVTYGY